MVVVVTIVVLDHDVLVKLSRFICLESENQFEDNDRSNSMRK